MPKEKGNSSTSLRSIPAAIFTSFWIAQAISLFGDRLNNFSLTALITKFSSDAGRSLSELYLAMFLPLFILAPFIGILVDRMNKRWILVITDLVRGILVMLIPLIYIAGGPFFGVLIIVFILSTGNLFFLPAKSAIIPEIVPKEKLLKVNSILWMAGIVGIIGGFLGGGIIFDYLSWKACFYIDAGTYVVSAFLLLSLFLYKKPLEVGVSREAAAQSTTLKFIIEGVRELKSSWGLIHPLFVQTLVYFGAGAFSIIAVSFIKDASPSGSSLGLSYAGIAIGAGMAAGSYLVNELGVSATNRWKIEMAFFILIFPAVSIMAVTRNIPGIVLSSFLGGAVSSPLVILAESDLQRESKHAMRGRIFSLREITTKSFFLLSAFIFSTLDDFISRENLLIALGLFLACTGTAWTVIMKKKTTGIGNRR